MILYGDINIFAAGVENLRLTSDFHSHLHVLDIHLLKPLDLGHSRELGQSKHNSCDQSRALPSYDHESDILQRVWFCRCAAAALNLVSRYVFHSQTPVLAVGTNPPHEADRQLLHLARCASKPTRTSRSATASRCTRTSACASTTPSTSSSAATTRSSGRWPRAGARSTATASAPAPPAAAATGRPSSWRRRRRGTARRRRRRRIATGGRRRDGALSVRVCARARGKSII
jgi:hypothetical protein